MLDRERGSAHAGQRTKESGDAVDNAAGTICGAKTGEAAGGDEAVQNAGTASSTDGASPDFPAECDSCEDLASLIAAIPEAMAYYGPDDRLVAFNHAYTQLYGDLSCMIRAGVSFYDVIRGVAERGLYAPEQESLDAFLERRIEAHRLPDSVHDQRLHDGRWVQVHERRTPRGGVVGIWTDVTALYRRQEVLTAALTNMSDGIMVLDRELRVIAWNQQFIDLLTYPEGFLREGIPVVELYRFHSERGDYVSIGFQYPAGIGVQFPATLPVAEPVVQGVHGRVPRAPRSAPMADAAARVGGTCGPPWATLRSGS